MVWTPFLLDPTVTLLRRIAKGERFWEPHRSHLYQRLVLAGASHRQVSGGYAAMTLAAGIAATFVREQYVPPWLALAIFSLLTALIWVLLLRRVQ